MNTQEVRNGGTQEHRKKGTYEHTGSKEDRNILEQTDRQTVLDT